jgi:tRNA dimethylallyltransferase
MLVPKRDYDLSQRPDLWKKRVCEPCGAAFMNENDWSLHMKSRGHRRALGVKKREANAKTGRLNICKEPQADLVDILQSHQQKLEQQELPE